MDFTPTPFFYLFIGLMTGLIVGWAIGFFDSNSRTAKKIDAAEAKAATAMREAERKIAAAQAKTAAESATAAADNPGLLRLKNDNGRMTLELDGAPITEALSPDKKKRLIELITVFRPWLEGGLPYQSVPQPSAPIQAPRPPAPVQPTGSSLPPLSPAKPVVDEKNIRSLSIVAQIDTVLQMRLLDTPLAGKGIRLSESSVGGVEVYVGLDKYPSLDDVPDLEIKNTIRAAIAEWEQKYVPGM